MARRILIVEDNDGAAALLAELAGELGAEPVRARGGREALDLAAKALPDLAIVDVVLGDLDGFQVAQGLRALAGGADLPLVVVSGVYKKLPDAFVEKVRPHFLAKPFEPAQLRSLLERIFGAADAAQGLRRGRFKDEPPVALFVRLCEERATGLLEVQAGDVRRRVFWQAGHVRFAQSNVRAESAGGMQVFQGTLTPAAFERAVAHAKQARVPLHEGLVQSGAMTEAQVAEALRAQTAAVARGVLSMPGAEWSFSAAEVERQPDARVHPIAVILEAARQATGADDAREGLLARGAVKLARSPLLERELFAVRAAWPGETVTALASARPTAQELAARARPEDLPLAWALVASGLLAREGAAQAPRADAPAPASAAEEADRGRRFTPRDEEARRFIFAERDRTAGLDLYALLGVPKDAPPEDCRRAYIELARRYHSDAYSGLELGSAGEALSELFQRTNDAMETLTDAKRRAEYDIYLDRKAKGLPTDVAAILRAEELFQRGEALLRANKPAEALDVIGEAIQLNAAEPEFHAYYGFALYRANGVEALHEARRHIQKAIQEGTRLASGHLFLGVMAREAGDFDEAIRQLERALELDPKNEQAVRELRVARTRRDKGPDGKSILKKLFGR